MAFREGTAARIRLAATIAAVALLVRPFPARSEAEAAWDALRLADTVAQIKRGTFPVYVGQSEAVPDGTPYAGAPVRAAAGAAVHFLTLGRCSPATVERIVVLLSVLGGIWAAYYGLRSVLRDHRRVRFLLSVTYAAGCAALWQKGRCSETAVVAVPLIPLLCYELIRGARRPDFRAAGACAALLALLWMAHPPTGLAATVVAAVGVGSWRSARGLLWAAGLFALLSAWFFAGAVPLGVFPIRAAWLTDQCALPVAAGCAVAALVLRRLMAADRWELALEMEQPSGEPDPIVRLRPLTALGVLVLGAVAVACAFVGRTPTLDTTARPEPVAPLPVSARVFPSARSPVHTDDPVLHNHLTQTAGGNSTAVHNAAFVPLKPDGAAEPVPQPARPAAGYAPVHATGGQPILHFVVQPGRRYVLTLEYWTKNYRGSLRVAGGGAPQTVPLPLDSDGVRGLRLSVVGASEPEVVELSLVGRQLSEEPGSGVYCGSVGLNAYRPDDLPVRVSSVAPYAAAVRVDGDEGFLVTHRRFAPGYAARVSGQSAPVFRSADGFVAVRVPAGASEVQLRYRGTFAMRVGFAASALTALGLIVAAVWGVWNRVRRSIAPAATTDVWGPAPPVSRAA